MYTDEMNGKSTIFTDKGQIKCDISILSILSVEEILFIEMLLDIKFISS